MHLYCALIPLAVYGGPNAVPIVVLLGLGWLVMLSLVGSTSSAIYRSALYVYAVEAS